MKKSLPLLSALSLALLGLAAVPRANADGSLRVYASQPYAYTDSYSGAQIETFNSFAAGGTFTTLTSSATTGNGGTYVSANGTSKILANDIYAASTGSGNYLAVLPNDSVSLTLAAAVPYVGIDIAAVDAGNNIAFYDANNSLIGTFNAGTVSTLFPNTAGTQVTAVNGAKYNTTAYYGQPNTAGTGVSANNPAQAYAYLHFFGQNGTTIKRIVFSEAAGGNFETENHSILAAAPAVDGTFVSVGTVPEPGLGAMVAAGCAGLLVLTRLRRSRV